MLHPGRRRWHHRRPGPALELPVPRDVVAVAVRVGDDQLDPVQTAAPQPPGDDLVDDTADRQHPAPRTRIRPGSRVEQDCPRLAEEQVQEVALEAEALAHPEDEGVLVERVHLDVSALGRVGARLADVPGFSWTDAEGRPVPDPDALLDRVPALRLAVRGRDVVELLRPLYRALDEA